MRPAPPWWRPAPSKSAPAFSGWLRPGARYVYLWVTAPPKSAPASCGWRHPGTSYVCPWVTAPWSKIWVSVSDCTLEQGMGVREWLHPGARYVCLWVTVPSQSTTTSSGRLCPGARYLCVFAVGLYALLNFSFQWKESEQAHVLFHRKIGLKSEVFYWWLVIVTLVVAFGFLPNFGRWWGHTNDGFCLKMSAKWWAVIGGGYTQCLLAVKKKSSFCTPGSENTNTLGTSASAQVQALAFAPMSHLVKLSLLTRMHSSRMRTACLLPVSPSMHCLVGGGTWSHRGQGVYLLGRCTCWGVPGPGGYLLGGCGCTWLGVPAWGVYLPGGGGVPALGGVPAGGYLVPGLPAGGWGCTCPGVPAWGVYLPGGGGGGTCPGTPPLWTEFLSHASENITLPQTSFASDKYY